MSAPASPHFSALSLATAFNVRRDDLPDALRAPRGDDFFGARVIGGIPFAFGAAGEKDVVYLNTAPVEIA